jgi:rhodanese-related sulfurtransferase
VRFQKVYLFADSHAGYYPGATTMFLKLLFSPEASHGRRRGQILGAQAAGRDGVDKRIDVLATALRAGLTVFDLETLELCYAPPYGSAKDPVNMAGFLASNVLRGDMPVEYPQRLAAGVDEAEAFVLDVRSREEYEAGHVEGAYLIPVDELRDRLDEVPRDRPVLAYCKSGLRSYLATRILRQKGFEAFNVTGAYDAFVLARSALRRAGGAK